MSDLNGPKKETVRITLPPRVPPGGVGGAPRGTTKIGLSAKLPGDASAETPRRVLPPPPPPSRRMPPPPPAATIAPAPMPVPRIAPPAAAAVPPPPPMPPRPRVLPPPPRIIPLSAVASSVTAAPANYPGSGTQSGPRKETARITILPEPVAPMSATVKMAKTQPLLTVPAAKPLSAPVIVAATDDKAEPATSPLDMLDSVPMPVCWTIFAISSVTLLIQIWNYFSA